MNGVHAPGACRDRVMDRSVSRGAPRPQFLQRLAFMYICDGQLGPSLFHSVRATADISLRCDEVSWPKLEKFIMIFVHFGPQIAPSLIRSY